MRRSDVTIIYPGRYPESLRKNEAQAPVSQMWAIGNPDLLHEKLLALFCSKKYPGEAILRAYDLARALRDAGVPVISGFHTPMEKECFDLLLRGTQPVVVCPARGIQSMRIPSAWRIPLSEGRLLVLSPFEARYRRHTAELAEQRNRLLGLIAHSVLVIHAAPQSKTERLCLDLLRQGKAIYVLREGANHSLLAAGARSTTVETIPLIKKGRRGRGGACCGLTGG